MINIKGALNFGKEKQHIGLDIGTYYMKVVQLESTEHGFRLFKKNILNIRNDIGKDGFSRKIQTFLQKKGYFLNGKFAVNIEHPSLLIRRMDLPKMPDRDLDTAIRWNFREFVEGSPDDYFISYSHIKGFDVPEKVPLCAYCVSRETVSALQEMMQKVGVRLSSIEPNATALLAVFNHVINWDRGKYYVILDLGFSVSNFIVVGNGSLMFSKPLSNLNGRKLISLLSKSIAVEESEAERILGETLLKWNERVKNVSVEESELLAMVKETISQFVSLIVVEVQRSIDSFCLMYKRERVDKIYLCGGGIDLPDIDKRFTSGLGVKAEVFNPFSKIMDVDESIYDSMAPMYTLAVGLALPWE